jgi:cell wall assembly regulator SMI1
MTALLDDALLGRLEAAWRERGALIADHLAPGLTDDEMRRLVEPLGIGLPLEARRWWGWHDGVTTTAARAHYIGPDFGILSLGEAVQLYETIRLSVDPDEISWKPTWMPIVSWSRGDLAIDCTAADETPVPVHAVDWEVGVFAAPAMREMVDAWLAVMANGGWRWERSENYWRVDTAKLPTDERLRLVT